MTRVHFIGICGTAMGTLAAMLKRQGCDVQGSDQYTYPPMSDFLARERIRVFTGFSAEHVTSSLDFVVVGNSISRGNVELEAVLDRKVRYRSLPETVREFFLWDARSIVIAGTHGKTTTTAMTAWLLTSAGRDPSALVGGIAANLGADGSSFRLGRGRDFVIEGDEYDSAFFDKSPKFLKYVPDIAVVGNVEFDHADIYRDLAGVQGAFERLVNLVPQHGRLLLGADSPQALALEAMARSPVETVGLGEAAYWHAHALVTDGFGTRFAVRRQGQPWGEFFLPMPGAHNVRNALAALAIGAAVGLEPDALATGLREFQGVKRRLEVAGEVRGVRVYDDFAHHPTAIGETLAAVRRTAPTGRVWAVFEPRSASSCRKVFQEAFSRAFGDADEVVLASVFRANIPDDERLSVDELAADLRSQGQRARAVPEIADIVTLLGRECDQGDVVVFMSNGGFGGIHQRLLDRLGE